MKIAEKIVDSSFSAVIIAPIEKINIPEWVFNLSDAHPGKTGHPFRNF